MKSIANVLLIAFFGAFTFSVYGLSSSLGAGVSVGLSLFVPKLSGTLNAGLDLSNVTSLLGAYVRKYEKQIWQLVTQDIEFEKYMRKVSGVTDEYVITTGEVSELLQPYQNEWTPKGEADFLPRINKVRQIKVDYTVNNLDDVYRTYLTFLATEGVDRKEWPLVRYIVTELMVPKMREELAVLSAKGVYAAPTPGAAGASIDSVDGILTVVSDEITATNLTPITTGAITQADIIDKIEEDFVDALPTKYKSMATPIFMAEEMKMMYWRAYRGEFGGNANYDGKQKVFVDGTKKEIIGIPELNGSQRMIHTTKNNMLCMYDKIMTPNSMEVQKDKRAINVLTDFKRGYGFGNLSEVFVNDQA